MAVVKAVSSPRVHNRVVAEEVAPHVVRKVMDGRAVRDSEARGKVVFADHPVLHNDRVHG